MRWLRVHLRARRINKLAQSRLREKYMRGLERTDDNEQQADLCVQFEMKRRSVQAQDVRKIGCDWQKLNRQLDRTRTGRILGLE
jgi:hypothetical protein